MRMVVKGLGGEFAVLSGNALLLYSQDTKKILSLPSEIDFKGTMIIVRIPDQSDSLIIYLITLIYTHIQVDYETDY